ncbi:MAG: hypothetical protein HUJ54_04835 [Erysipelotrichaceae bacterium]|nr:hypothetical protein [Erysipelotrichaceae bacterium]
MEDKDIRRLRRYELVDIIYELQEHQEELEKQISELKEQLKTRQMTIEKAGSIAGAVMELNDVAAIVQKAADEYLTQIELLKQDTEQKNREAAVLLESLRKQKAEVPENS